jgi:hypothetical protein
MSSQAALCYRMIATSLILAFLNLSGCDRRIVYCEGPRIASPGGRCNAQLVQDVSTNGAYATVECDDWHSPPYPDWNALILNGPHTPLAIAWLGDRSLEFTIPRGADVRHYQPLIQGRSYTVATKLLSSDTTITGCGLDP